MRIECVPMERLYVDFVTGGYVDGEGEEEWGEEGLPG